MSVVTKKDRRSVVHPAPSDEIRDERQLRRDRWTAALVLVLLIGLMILTIWLGAVTGVEYDGVDYWHLMP